MNVLTGKKHKPIPTEDWHNLRIAFNDGRVHTDFEMSVAEAVDTAFHNNTGIVNIAKVEFRGAHIGQPYTDRDTGEMVSPWFDVTDHFKALYNERITRDF